MESDKIYNLLEKMYVEFANRFEKIDERFQKIDERFQKVDERFDRIETKLDQKADKTEIIRLENELNSKFDALFDGQKQLAARLDRIEEKSGMGA